MLDDNLKPILLEVNHNPSLRTDSEVDMRIKKTLVEDTFKILGMNVRRKKKM